MMFEINRLSMLDAAKNAARVAPSESPVDVLNGILVECNDDTAEVFLTATNYEVSIQQKVTASISESGSMLINARLLVGLLSLLPGEYVTFSATTPTIIMLTGSTYRYEINCLPAQHYPKPVMPFPEETVKLSGICSLAKRTTFVVAKDENKPALQCVNVKLRHNTVHATACDGIKLMMIKDAAGSPNECDFLLPGRSLQMLASISNDKDVFDVGDIGNEIVFTRNDMMFTMKKLPGDYFDVTTIIKSITPVYSAITETHLVREALNLITAGAGKEPLNLALSDGQIFLRRDGEYSQFQTMIQANIPNETPSDGFCYDINSLVKLFQVLEGRIKLEIDVKGVMLVKTRNEVYVQMPRQVTAKKVKSIEGVKESA